MEVVNTQHLPFELTKEYIEEVRLLIQNQATEEIIQKTDGLFPADITNILILFELIFLSKSKEMRGSLQTLLFFVYPLFYIFLLCFLNL